MIGFGSTPRQVPWWAGRAGLLALLVTVAYWLSLGSLWRDLTGQTPLAFIGLAPILAFGLLLAGLRRREALPFPGRADLVIGLVLILLAGLIVLLGPSFAAIYFWTARLDVASLPLFVAGALLLLFGWRVLFVARGALVLLLLAWPLPYLVLLENTSQLLTDATVLALRAVVAVIPFATPTSPTSANFLVANGADPFIVQVATACAGLNSTVAFTLVGSAFVLMLRGAWTRKLAWFATGLAFVFFLNIVRVVLLVAFGAWFGQEVALNLFHPIAGMVALAGGLITMLALLARFGLSLPDLRPQPPAATPLPARTTEPPRGALRLRVGLLTVLAILFGAVNSTFAAYEAGPSVTSTIARPVIGELAALGGWQVTEQHDIAIGKPYYGAESTWTRYRLRPAESRPADQRYTIFADSVTTPDRQALLDFGVDKCYRFHGHSIDAAEPVVLGSGVVGNAMAVTRATGSTWVVLWWEWPVEIGGRVVHERVTMLASTDARPDEPPTANGAQPLILFRPGTPIPADLRPVTLDMASVASEIVAEQTGTVAVR